MRTFARTLLLSVLVIGAATSCATPPPPPPPPAPLPAPPPKVGLSTQIIELASTYRAVMSAAGGMAPTFASGEDVAGAVKIGASYEQAQLQQGSIAFAAVAALQEPTFVASVRTFANDRIQRELLINTLIANPGYAATFPNSDKAAGLAIAAIDGMGAKVMVAGRAVKQSAYDIQRQPWSRATVQNSAERLTGAKDLSTRRLLADAADVAALRQASAGEAAMSLNGVAVPPPYSTTITNGLAIAAIAALGGADDGSDQARLAPLLVESETAYCLNMAKLNLYQCLAVAGPHYEDIFCLGQHGLMDTGQCMISAAGSPTPAFVAPPPPIRVASPTPQTKSKARR